MTPGSPRRVTLLAEMAQKEKSPLVRLYLERAQRVEVKMHPARVARSRGGCDDPNLPLMYWYATESVVAADSKQAFNFWPARFPSPPIHHPPNG